MTSPVMENKRLARSHGPVGIANGAPPPSGRLRMETATITPQIAAEWLLHNTRNRVSKPKAISRYAADMLHGQWSVNGESIKFFEDGTLADGQNRLLACIEAGVPFDTVVVWGIPPDGQNTTDVGVRRSLADVLTLRGEVTTKELASVITAYWKFIRDPRDMSATVSPSVPESLSLLEGHPGFRDSVRAADAVRGAVGLRSSIGATLHYITNTIDQDDAEAFWERLAHGVGLDADDPVLRLRELLIADRVKAAQRMTFTRTWAVTVKAWNAYREGRPVKVLNWRPGGARPEPMPVPA